MGEPIPTWGAAAREAAALTPVDESVLGTIGLLPLVPTQHLALVCGASSPATVYRHVHGLVQRRLVAVVRGPKQSAGPHRGLLLVSNLGLAALSCRLGVEPASLARRWRLDPAKLEALVRELPAVLASYELLALVADRVGKGMLVQLWRRPWRFTVEPDATRASRRISLPALAALIGTTPDCEHRAQTYVVVADTGDLPPALLPPRLAGLGQALGRSNQPGPGVAVATTSLQRAGAWRAALESAASRSGGHAVDARVATWDAWRSGNVAPPQAGCTGALVRSELALTGLRSAESCRAWLRVPQPIGLDRVRASAGVWSLCAGNRAVLDVVGRHPFLSVRSVGEILGESARWARERSSELVGRGLLRPVTASEWPANVSANGELLEATARGLALLSGSMGLSLKAAVRYHGLAGGGPDNPIGPRRALARHLAHTLGADAVFGALALAARREGGSLVEWRNAAACVHGRVRPDGYGVLRLGRREYGFFLEFDRGTVRPEALRRKFAAYQRYRASARAERDYDGFPTILVVTAGPAAEERLAGAVRAADSQLGSTLPILLTTLGWMQAHPDGSLGAIWRGADGRRQCWPHRREKFMPWGRDEKLLGTRGSACVS